MIKVLIKTFVYLYHHYRMTNFKCIPNLLNYSAIFRIIYVICWTLWLAGLDCRGLSGRGFGDGLITHPDQSY